MKLDSFQKDVNCMGFYGCENASEALNLDRFLGNSNGCDSKTKIMGNLEVEQFADYPEEVNSKIIGNCVESDLIDDPNGVLNTRTEGSVSEQEHDLDVEECNGTGTTFDLDLQFDKTKLVKGDKLSQQDFERLWAFPRGNEVPVLTATIGKNCFDWSLTHCLKTPTQWKKLNVDQILGSPAVVNALASGFVVKKLQKRQLSGSMDVEEFEEFELKVPPGSILLFPSEKAVSIEDLEGSNFEVKNLIVLDGTWRKAKRMYYENPWLKFLPHLKLDVNKMSLYSEVRKQPKAGYLSTIESIIYAMKAVGDRSEGLDNLLDVFESMVVDQRQCRDEALKKSI